MRTERLFSSTSFRLSAAYAVLLIIAFLAIAGVAWISTKEAAEREVRERVQLEMNALLYEIRVEGVPEAVLAIHSRIEESGALEYRLVDATGKLLVGNFEQEAPNLGWGHVLLHDRREAENETEDFLTLTERTSDGSVLTIGDDLDKAEGVRAAVLNALFWVAAPTLLLVIGIGIFLAAGTARRMSALTRAMDSVGKGDLEARAPEKGSDEIARIGHGVNEMVARIDSLVLNMRRVSTDIAHDLRTPLAHVRQDLETAAISADPATREGIKAAQARIDDVLRVFHAIMRLAEIDTGSAQSRFVPVDLASIVERVTDAYRPDIESKGRSLVVETHAGARINGDPDLVVLALANVLENAMRHTPTGSVLKVTMRNGLGSVGIAVEDSGLGIPESELQRVLEPFVRLDRSRTTPGAGLGLSIVNAIARAHGAKMVLEDAKPGLRVSINWPVAA